jgi:hypothetical protein
MANERFRCRCCGKLKARRTPDQRYCSEPVCQKARKNAWRRERYAADPDYRLNQRESTKVWLDANGGAAEYYRQYRRDRKKRRDEPSRAEGGTDPVAFSAARCREAAAANSDAMLQKNVVISGRYELVPVGGANRDAFEVEIRIISGC